ncbi:predicted protein [Streptomyces iranensis]|uniref:Uncharacterized protein n=1 Tax=Streptomyces iranensis TaxID=576784 RepID=A0A060ZZ66_9ACTN|nr:predicted protein [Streptomyces iranensis]
MSESKLVVNEIFGPT